MGRGTYADVADVRITARAGIDARIAALHEPALLPIPDDESALRQVLWDVDSTVFQLLEAMRRLPGGENVDMASCHDWDALPEMCGGVPRMLELFDGAMSLESMRAVGTIAGSVAASHCHARHGVRIHFATIRDAGLGPDTELFLRESGFAFESFHCSLKLDKVALCEELGIPVIVDDQPATLEAAHAAGIVPLALRLPYNEATLRDLGTHHAGDDWHSISAETLATIAGLEQESGLRAAA